MHWPRATAQCPSGLWVKVCRWSALLTLWSMRWPNRSTAVRVVRRATSALVEERRIYVRRWPLRSTRWPTHRSRMRTTGSVRATLHVRRSLAGASRVTGRVASMHRRSVPVGSRPARHSIRWTLVHLRPVLHWAWTSWAARSWAVHTRRTIPLILILKPWRLLRWSIPLMHWWSLRSRGPTGPRMSLHMHRPGHVWMWMAHSWRHVWVHHAWLWSTRSARTTGSSRAT